MKYISLLDDVLLFSDILVNVLNRFLGCWVHVFSKLCKSISCLAPEKDENLSFPSCININLC